jgi:hypothetical protein
VLEAVFILLEFPSHSRRIFISSHSLPPSLVRRIGPSNPILVPKETGGLRMCIDYTDLNKHYPKDPFPLPCIDQVVDSTAGSILLCFLDCYSGYYQIALHPDDEDKTTFITPHGIYCYRVMTFGLKNTGATYQKAIQKCLKS